MIHYVYESTDGTRSVCVCECEKERKKDSCTPYARVIRYYNYKPSSRIRLQMQQQLGSQQAVPSLGPLLFHLFLKSLAHPPQSHLKRRIQRKTHFLFKVIKPHSPLKWHLWNIYDFF